MVIRFFVNLSSVSTNAFRSTCPFTEAQDQDGALYVVGLSVGLKAVQSSCRGTWKPHNPAR